MRRQFENKSKIAGEVKQYGEDRAALEDRIAHKINVITEALSQHTGSVKVKADFLGRMSRIAKMADNGSLNTLRIVEAEVDAVYKSKELDEMRALTTYDYENPVYRDVVPKQDFTGVRGIVSSWSTFAEVDDLDTSEDA